MPFDLAGSIRKTSQWAFSSPLLNNILGSSLFVALTISLLMVLLIMVLYPAKKGTKFSVLCKLFIYMFFGTLLIIFLHDSVIKFMFEETEQEKEDVDFMRGTTHGGKDGVYNQSMMVAPSMPVPVLGSPQQVLQSQQPMPVPGAPVVNDGDDGGDDNDDNEIINVVENENVGVLGGGRVPMRKPNMYVR
jgi:hypothetical protein